MSTSHGDAASAGSMLDPAAVGPPPDPTPTVDVLCRAVDVLCGAVDGLCRAGSAKRTRPSRQCSAQVQEIERNPISSMLAQLMPVSGGFAASQLWRSAGIARA